MTLLNLNIFLLVVLILLIVINTIKFYVMIENTVKYLNKTVKEDIDKLKRMENDGK